MFRLFSTNRSDKNTGKPYAIVERKTTRWYEGIYVVFSFAMISALFVSLISPATAQAATLNDESSLSKQVLAYSTYWSMVDCLAQEKQQIDDAGFGQSGFRITEAHVKAGTWWMTEGNIPRATSQGAESPGSYLNSTAKKDSGNVLCNNVMKTMSGILGYTDYLKFICTFVKYRADSSSCAGSATKSDFGGIANSIDTFKSVVGTKLWSNGKPSLTLDTDNKNAGLYLIYRDAFINGCSAVESKNPAKDFKYENIRIIENDGKDTTETYEGINRGDSRALYREGGSTVSANCATIADKVNELSKAFKAYFLSGGQVETEGDLEVIPDACVDSDASNDPSEGCVPTGTTSCPVDGIGWMVCPVLNAVGGLNDAMLGWLESILTVKPLSVSSENGLESPQYTAWNTMRNIANVVLVIAFFIIIFSQLTGFGVTNYGVKKTLPRLIVIAILINISFYIMAIAVDLTNIIGGGINDLFATLTPNINAASFSTENVISSFLTGSALVIGGTTITAAVIASGSISLSALALMALPIVLTAALALFAAFATLFVRNALIIVLVIISPLAIAAYLLPNTQNLFTQWRKLFISMLVLFPMAALLFAGAKFAASVTVQSNEPLSALIAIFIMAVPLGMLPFLIKSSNSLLGNVGNRLSGLARSARNPLRKAVDGKVQNQKAKYQSGQRNFFGGRQKAGSTNAAQRFDSKRRSRELETSNLQGAAQENWRESGLTGTSKAAQRAGRAIDNEKTLSTRKGAIEGEYKARSDQRKNTLGTQDNLYNTRAENSSLESQTHEAELARARTQRVASSTSLSALDTRMRTAQEGTKTTQVEQDLVFARAKQTDPGLINLHERQVDAELKAGAVSASMDAETAIRQNADSELKNFKLDTEASKREKGLADKQFDEVVAEASTKAGQEKLTDAGFDSGTLEILRDTQIESSVAASAIDSAQRVQQQEYATELQTQPPVMAARAGGIDPYGASRVSAAASSLLTDSVNKAIASEKTTMSTLAVADGVDPSGNPTDGLRSIMENPRGDDKLPPERRAAAVGKIVTSGTDDDIFATLDYLGSLPNTTPQEKETRLLLQQQFMADIGGRKPISIGAGDMTGLSRGEYTGRFDEKIAGRLKAGKVSAETLATGTTADELKRIVTVLKTDQGLRSSQELATIKQQLDAYMANPNTKKPAGEILTKIEEIRTTISST